MTKRTWTGELGEEGDGVCLKANEGGDNENLPLNICVLQR